MAVFKPFAGKTPTFDPGTVYLAQNTTLVGDVTLSPGVSVWYGAVVRADLNPIQVGENTNIQDNAVLHTDHDHALRIGKNVTVGHSAVVHGCTVGDGCLVGMHATILSGAVVGEGSVIAAGALVTGHMDIPPQSLVVGVPARVRGSVTKAQLGETLRSAASYLALAKAQLEKV